LPDRTCRNVFPGIIARSEITACVRSTTTAPPFSPRGEKGWE
jgi:hypothetical protein